MLSEEILNKCFQKNSNKMFSEEILTKVFKKIPIKCFRKRF